MNDQHIRLRTVYELRLDESSLPIRYFIPAYQGGYRWTCTQVTQLLNDLHEFTRRKNPQPGDESQPGWLEDMAAHLQLMVPPTYQP